MSYRITQKDLDSAISTMNGVSGRPKGYEKGAFIVTAQNGGYGIGELQENGGQRTILSTSPAREVHAFACAWIAGYEDARKGNR